MTYKICEVVELEVEVIPEVRDQETGEVISAAVIKKQFVQQDRDATPAEEAEFDARRNNISERVRDAICSIDDDVDSIYSAAIGNRATEYMLAENNARSYVAASYSGVVPDSVHSWALAKNKTDKWAADDIITASDFWRVAQNAIRSNRLSCKQEIKNAKTMEDIKATVAVWNVFLSKIKKQLGI